MTLNNNTDKGPSKQIDVKSHDESKSFFDAFRQSLEEKLNKRRTVEELREECKSYIDSKADDPLCFLVESESRNDRICSEDTDPDNRCGDPNLEGRILCLIYAVTLHVVEKRCIDGAEKWTYQILKNAKSNFVDQDKRAIHIMKLSDSNFLPIFSDQQNIGYNVESVSNHRYNNGNKEDNDNSQETDPFSFHTYGINPENPPEFDQKCKRFWRINVPKNSDCLFLSFILAYLIPILDDDYEFKERFSRLCGCDFESNDVKCEIVKDLLRSFNPFLNMSRTYDNRTLIRLVKLLRNRAIEHLDIFSDNSADNHSFGVKHFDSWCDDTEIQVIEEMMGCNIHAIHSGQSGDSHKGCDASLVELVYDIVQETGKNESKYYYNFFVPKEYGDKYAVYCRLDQFVRSFVVQFIGKLQDYQNQLIPGGKTHVEDPGMMVGAIGQAIGGAISFGAGFGLSGASAGKKIASGIATLVSEQNERKLAKKIVTIFEPFMQDEVRFKEVLVKVAGEIFRNFECQFVKFTDQCGTHRAMNKMAEDAILRIVNYIDSTEFDIDEEIDCLMLITKGIILGKSRINKTMKCGRTLIDEDGKSHRSKDIFEKTGLIVSDGRMGKYYNPIKVGGGSEYGYRFPFDWENTDEWQKSKYMEQNATPTRKYDYLINSRIEYDRKLKDIIDDFNDAARISLITEEVQNSMKEGQHLIHDKLEAISKKQDIHFNHSIERIKCIQGDINELKIMVADVRKLTDTTLLTDRDLDSIKESSNALFGMVDELSKTVSDNAISTNERLLERAEEVYVELRTAVRKLVESQFVETEKIKRREKYVTHLMKDKLEGNESARLLPEPTNLVLGNLKILDEKIEGVISVLDNLIQVGNPTTSGKDLGINVSPTAFSEIVVPGIANELQEAEEIDNESHTELVKSQPTINHNREEPVPSQEPIEFVDDQHIPPKTITCKDDDNMPKLFLEKHYIQKIGFEEKGSTKLHVAAALGRKDQIQTYIETEFYSNSALTDNKCTPLYFAAQNGHVHAVAYLSLVSGMEPSKRWTFLNKANRQKSINMASVEGNTPLHAAVYNNHLLVVDTLLRYGADLYVKNNNGLSPFFYAVQNGFDDILEALLKHHHRHHMPSSDDISVVPGTKANLLHYAAQYGHDKIVRLLLKNQVADCNVQTIGVKMTPLHVAVLNNKINVVKTLLEAKDISVDLGDINSETPVQYAMRTGDLETLHTFAWHKHPVKPRFQGGHVTSDTAHKKKNVLNATSQLFVARDLEDMKHSLRREVVSDSFLFRL